MSKERCINHDRVVYDFCRSCKGYETNCPEYLGRYEVKPLGKKLNLRITTKDITDKIRRASDSGVI